MRTEDEIPDTDSEEVLALFSEGEPLTAPEVAADVGLDERVAEETLSSLVDCGRLDSKVLGAGTRAYYLGVDRDDVSGSTSNGQPREGLFERTLENSPVGAAVVNADGEIVYANERMAEVLGRPMGDVLGRAHDDPDWDIAYPDGTPIPASEHPVTRVLESGEPVLGFDHRIDVPGEARQRWLSSNSAPVVEDGEVAYVVVGVEDVTDLKRQERRLAAHNEELTRLARVTSVIRTAARAVVEAESPDEIERIVCGAVATSDPYLFAVLGHFSSSYDSFTPRNWAGVGREYLDAILEESDAPSLEDSVGARASRTGEIQVVQDVDDLPYDYWQEAAREHRFHSYASIPLVARGEHYGVLAVYAREPRAFDGRERTLLAELGDVVAHGVYVAHRELDLRQTQAVELTFSSREIAEDLADAGLDGVRIDVDRVLHLDGDRRLLYHSVTGVDPQEYVEVVSGNSRVRDARLLAASPDGCRVEVETTGETPASAFDDGDGRVVSMEVEDGTATITGRVPRSADVERVSEAVLSTTDDLQLVDRSLVQTPQSLWRVIEPSLTDRQSTVVQVAHSAGYFERPRESTGQELAGRLDVTATTFHRHLRNAQRRVFRRLFEDEDVRSASGED